MKIKTILVLLLTLLIGACDSLSLEEEPHTFVTPDQFFNDAGDAEAALTAAYASLQDLEYYRGRFLSNLTSFADYTDGRGSYLPGASYNCDNSCRNRIGSSWARMYQSIFRANLAIERIPGIKMNEAQKSALVAEAKFIRALNYYNLVRYWGGVPLRTEAIDDFEKLALPRASAQEVYALVISDLQEAEQVLPDAAANGRATKWAAKTLLADVYLGLERWSEAAAKAREVMDSGRFSLVQVTAPDDFLKLFGPEVTTSSEEIFDVPFTRVTNYGWEYPAMLVNPPSRYAAGAYNALFGDTKSFLGTWDPKDLRYQYDLFVGADAKYLTAAEPQRFKKFRDPNGVDRQGNGGAYPVVRYADALLIFAESQSQASGGPTAAAYDALNQIRRRAYGQSLTAPSPYDAPAGLGAAAFRDVVLQERAYEFLTEGKRYWDLKRSGTLAEKIAAVGETYDPKYLLWPIPTEEMDANNAFSLENQNPGW